MAVAAVAITVLAGGAGLVFTGESVRSWLATAVTLGFGLLLAALAEELIFRGFPLARLAAGIGKVGASAVLAVLFAGVHLGNPAVSPLGVLNVVLAALVLSAAFFTPGGLPAAWGVHLGWNAGLALGADAPVSGLTFRVPAVEFAPGRLGWVTGGAFGPEGGVGASLVMVIALIWLVWYARRVGGGGAT
jgi:membrane protease YdiL (CAAX protease family)